MGETAAGRSRSGDLVIHRPPRGTVSNRHHALVRNGTVRVTRGVWRPPELVEHLAGVVAAMLTACPPLTVVCGITAALLHGLWLPPEVGRWVEVIVRPDVSAPSARSHNRRPGLRARRQLLAPDEWTWLDGIPVTTEARTWLDLAAVLSPPDLVAAGDSALRGSATLAEIEHLISRARHRPGVVAARQALPLLNERSRSRPESHMRYAIVAAGLPEPAVNVPVFDDLGQWLFEPDLGYDDVKLALEYNGSQHAQPRRMQADISRTVDAGIRGQWRTETFGPIEVFRRPDQLAAYVRYLRESRRTG